MSLRYPASNHIRSNRHPTSVSTLVFVPSQRLLLRNLTVTADDVTDIQLEGNVCRETPGHLLLLAFEALQELGNVCCKSSCGKVIFGSAPPGFADGLQVCSWQSEGVA